MLRSIRSLALLFIPLSLGILTGCARSVVTTEVTKEGGWKRTVKLYGNVAPKEGTATDTLDKVFLLPKGPEWKTGRAVENSSKKGAAPGPFDSVGQTEVYTAERTFKAGEAMGQDIALKSEDAKVGKPMLVNQVHVRQIAPGRFEYREVLHWQGPILEEGAFETIPLSKSKITEELKKVLPAKLATPEKMKVLSEHLKRSLWMMMFGPNDPLLSEMPRMLIFPDAVGRKLMRRFNLLFDEALVKTFGDELPAEKRHEITRLLSQNQQDALKDQAQEKASSNLPGMEAPDKKKKEGNFVAMTFSVHLPGRIVETNGEVDTVLNEVSWSLYSPAAMLGDVELRAVCDTNP